MPALAAPQDRRATGQSPLIASAPVVAALVVAVVTFVGALLFRHDPTPGASPEVELPGWALALFCICLLLGVVAAWLLRQHRVGCAIGLSAAVIGAALPAWGSWTALSTTARSAALVMPAITVAGLSQVAPRWSPKELRPRPTAAAGAVAWSTAAVAVTLHLLTYDPFGDAGCVRVCQAVAAPFAGEVSTGHLLVIEGVLLLACGMAGLVGVATAQALPPAVRLSSGIGILSATVVETLGDWMGDVDWARGLSVWLPWSVGVTATAICVVELRAAAQLRRLDVLLHELTTDLGSSRVQFAVPGEDRWVDAVGNAERDDEGRQDARWVVLLSDEHEPAVRARMPSSDAAAALPAPLVVTPSRRLALSNARLTAITAARVADLRAAQQHIIQRSDAERHRIERDLHDGAQQNLVSALFHLAAAAPRNERPPDTPPGRLAEAREAVSQAVAGLRQLAHGPVPSVLVDEGLEAALQELAYGSDTRLRVRFVGDVAFYANLGLDVSTIAFMTVQEAVAASEGSDGQEVTLSSTDGRLLVDINGGGLNRRPPDALVDRIGAFGGTFEPHPEQPGWAVDLPCEW